MVRNSRGTVKRITASFFGLICGIMSALIGLGIIYFVIRWLETIHILLVIGTLLLSWLAIGQGVYFIYWAIREAIKSGKDEAQDRV